MTIRLDPTDVQSLPREELRRMDRALREAFVCQSVLARTGHTVASDLHRPVESIDDWHHYPSGDVYDETTRGQYYFHRHPLGLRPDGEAGHFHLFMRGVGPDGKVGADCHHIVAVSIDIFGNVTRLFTTNLWVTGESWLPAERLHPLVDRFAIEHAQPSWPTNRWVSAVVAAFAGDIHRLIDARDAALAEAAAGRGLETVFEDREVEILSEMAVDLPARLSALTTAMLV
ncbi:MAG: hypothetical protein RLO50_09710 [Azospirillaceae bacterium]